MKLKGEANFSTI